MVARFTRVENGAQVANFGALTEKQAIKACTDLSKAMSKFIATLQKETAKLQKGMEDEDHAAPRKFGAFLVQAYVFVSWLEARALAHALHRKPRAKGPVSALLLKYGIELGAMPPVPWALAAVFLVLPFVMLWLVSPNLALGLVVLHVAAPLVYARLDR